MKTNNKHTFRPLFFFNKNKKITSCLSLVLMVAFLNLLVNCSYYNVKDFTTSPETIAKQMEDFNTTHKYVIIHSGESVWHLYNLVLNEEDKTITGIVQTVIWYHQYAKPREMKRVQQYNTKKQVPFNELHFTLSTIIKPDLGSQITIPFSDITVISINEKNGGRTAVTIVVGIVGVLAAIAIIVALTKSSCPFVYIKNGEAFVFTGELYPGVITANQQRDDYLPLPNFKAENNEYSIKITNELKEVQHTDFLQLLTVDHPENVEVLVDKNGKLHTFSSMVSPEKVMVDNAILNQKPALKKDRDYYLFNTEIENTNSTRNIVLEFDKPSLTNTAKLYVTAKNSMWLDYVFGKFNEQFGTYYPQFQKDQQLVSKEKSTKWINEQNIPLSVYLKTSKGWELVDKINAVGPMALRDMVIPIDVSNVTGNKLQIKLETGFMFWEVDYTGIDYTENLPIKLNYFEPSQAIDEDNNNVTDLLTKADRKYFVQPDIGNAVEVTFKTHEVPSNLKRSIFLINRGFYNYIRDYKGKPNFAKLKLFREAGAFTEFSKYEYEAIMDYVDQFDIALNDEK